MRQHFFVKYVKTKISFGPNGRKIDKIYHRVLFKLDLVICFYTDSFRGITQDLFQFYA